MYGPNRKYNFLGKNFFKVTKYIGIQMNKIFCGQISQTNSFKDLFKLQRLITLTIDYARSWNNNNK